MLYLFQTLPVRIQFIEWDRWIAGHLRQGEKTGSGTLQLKKGRWCYGPSLLTRILLLSTIKATDMFMYTPVYHARWKEIESEMTEVIPVAAVLADTEFKNKMLNKDTPWIHALLKTWQETIKLCELDNSIKLLQW